MGAAEQAAPVSAAEAAALFADLAAAPGLVLAVSGGPDSTALMVVAARWRAGLAHGPDLTAVTVDHRLRPESGAEAAAVRRLAGRLGVAHRTAAWTASKPATGLQEAARQARYRLLAAAARRAGASHVLTAHTLDDQAETVLFRLARGSGIAGLAGMARQSPLAGLVLVRPFLDLPKSRLLATLDAAGIEFLDDPSNRDPRFTRARLRGLMPALATEGLDVPRLALLARRLARAEAALEAAADSAVGGVSAGRPGGSAEIVLDAAGLFSLPAEIALRLLHRAITRVGDEGPVELGKLEALIAALSAARLPASGRIRRTLAGAVVTLEAGRLTVERAPPRRQRVAASRAAGGGRKRGRGPFTKSR